MLDCTIMNVSSYKIGIERHSLLCTTTKLEISLANVYIITLHSSHVIP